MNVITRVVVIAVNFNQFFHISMSLEDVREKKKKTLRVMTSCVTSLPSHHFIAMIQSCCARFYGVRTFPLFQFCILQIAYV